MFVHGEQADTILASLLALMASLLGHRPAVRPSLLPRALSSSPSLGEPHHHIHCPPPEPPNTRTHTPRTVSAPLTQHIQNQLEENENCRLSR